MDRLARPAPAGLLRLLPMLGVVSVEPYEGESGLGDSALCVCRAVHRSGTLTAGVAADPYAAWNRAATRASTRLVRRPFRGKPRDGARGEPVDDAAATDPDVVTLAQGLRRAGWRIETTLVAASREMRVVRCDAWSPLLAESRRGNGTAPSLDAAILEAILDCAANVVEAVWERRLATSG
jgi:hypothetical protein